MVNGDNIMRFVHGLCTGCADAGVIRATVGVQKTFMFFTDLLVQMEGGLNQTMWNHSLDLDDSLGRDGTNGFDQIKWRHEMRVQEEKTIGKAELTFLWCRRWVSQNDPGQFTQDLCAFNFLPIQASQGTSPGWANSPVSWELTWLLWPMSKFELTEPPRAGVPAAAPDTTNPWNWVEISARTRLTLISGFLE